MKTMVEDLLGYARLQFGKGLPIAKTWCEMSEVLQAAVGDAEATYPHVECELHITGDLGACYDATRLHQLFVNLLVNAGQHGLRNRPVKIEALGTGKHATVSITNDGIAIPDAALKSIFKPLVQIEADEPSDRNRTSLGLGLFIAREIAEGHGGTIRVMSDQVNGTTFVVELPRDFSCRTTSD